MFLFKGGPNHTFAAPEMLKYKDGELINIGGGMHEQTNMFDGSGTMILITGSAEWETTDEGTFVTYRGRRIKSTPEKPIATTGTASTVHPADWDGDGDFDLIVGDIHGSVWLIPNEGTAKSYAFGKEVRLTSVGSRAGPCAADWDGDGDLDLLVGCEDGSVSLFRNTGSARSPKLAAVLQLVPPGASLSEGEVPKEVRRGARSKICVADWNGDGRPDLLVGDVARQKPDRPVPTAEEQAEFDRIRRELEPLDQRNSELFGKLNGASRVRDEAERKKLQEEYTQLINRTNELRSKLPPDVERHGWVWLFLRK